MHYLIITISSAFKEFNLEEIESEGRGYSLRAMKEGIERVMTNRIDQCLEELARKEFSGTNS